MDRQEENIQVSSVNSKPGNFIRLLALLIGGYSIWLGYDLLKQGIVIQSKLTTPSSHLLNIAPGFSLVAAGLLIVVCALFRKDSGRLYQGFGSRVSLETQATKPVAQDNRAAILDAARAVILEDRLAIVEEAAIMAERRLSSIEAKKKEDTGSEITGQASRFLPRPNEQKEGPVTLDEVESRSDREGTTREAVDVPFYRKAISALKVGGTEGSGPSWSNVDDYDVPTMLRKQVD